MNAAILFLGFPVDPLFERLLTGTNPKLVEQFINEGYLTETHKGDIRYLGKKTGEMITIHDLELLENNIYSLIKRLVPEYPYEECPLYLFPIES